MNSPSNDLHKGFGESTLPSFGDNNSGAELKRAWNAQWIFATATLAMNRFFGWIGIRGKLLLLILGVIASVSYLGWMAVGSTINFFEKREKVDLKDESNITRLRLELMLAETEIAVRSMINGLPPNVDPPQGQNGSVETAMEKNETGSLSTVESDAKDLELPFPVSCSFSSDGLNNWEDRSNKFGLKGLEDQASKKIELKSELKKKLVDRLSGKNGAEKSQSIWSGVFWDADMAKMQLLVPTEKLADAKGYWLITLNVTRALDKNLPRYPREYMFLVNPGNKKELSYSPFGEPTKIVYRKRGSANSSRLQESPDSIILKCGTELKKAIDAYEDKIAESVDANDLEEARSTRRAGFEYPIGLKEGPKSSSLTLADLLSGDTDLSFMKAAWTTSTDKFPADIRQRLGNLKILQEDDLKASPFDPMKRITEFTGQDRSIHIRAGSEEELTRLQSRISGRLYDLLGSHIDLQWKTTKPMNGLVVNVSEIRGASSEFSDEPVLYFVRAVSLTEIRESAYETLSQYLNWALILALVAMTVVVLLAMYIAQPLVGMTETVDQISKVGITEAIGSDRIRGLLDNLPVHKHGEVGSLAKQFQKTFLEMLDQLRFKELAEKESSKKAAEANQAKLKEKDAVEESLAKSQFLAMISHDMRQPLHMIFTEMQLMMKQNLTESQSLKADAILASARRLKNLIQDILDYQRYMANDLAIERNEVSVQKFLHGIAVQFSHQAKETQNKLNVVCDFDRTIFTDQPKLERILVNLLSNAFKFTETGTITLQADLLRGNLIQFTVRDTGRGISEDKKAHIFSIQRTANQKGNPGGTGLGLYICHLLVQHMKGDIQFESKLGSGTTFTITLPTDFNEKMEVQGENPVIVESQSSSMNRKKTVLIIDDQPESRRSIRDSLPAGYRSIEAVSGEEGLRMAVEYLPDAITLDVEMPEMDGWMVLAELQKNETTQGIPVIMVTVHPNQNKATILGANGFISKPFDPIELSTTIRRILVERAAGSVMIVDDDASTRRDLKHYLESVGWKVIAAVDGEDAINKIQIDVPSLFIIDLYMPNLDGFALIEKLRNMPDTSHVPIVVLSAAYLSPEQKRFLQPRIQQYFAKGSSDLNAIQDEIERLISHQGQVIATI